MLSALALGVAGIAAVAIEEPLCLNRVLIREIQFLWNAEVHKWIKRESSWAVIRDTRLWPRCSSVSLKIMLINNFYWQRTSIPNAKRPAGIEQATRLWRDNECIMRYSSGDILGYAVLTLTLQIRGKSIQFLYVFPLTSKNFQKFYTLSFRGCQLYSFELVDIHHSETRTIPDETFG